MWKGSCPFGHTSITLLVEDNVPDMCSDKMRVRYSFSKPFKITIPSRQVWLSEGRSIPRAELEWYTDGSKRGEGTGAGIWSRCPKSEVSIPMGLYHSVFQVEVTAILWCAQENLRLGYKNKSINIFSDSQAALKALDSCEFRSKLVWDCYNTLSRLGTLNMITLCWVPGHSGIVGNEGADALANNAATTKLEGPQPFCGIPNSAANLLIRTWIRTEHKRRWQLVQGHRMSKLVLSKPSSIIASDLLLLRRDKLRLVIGLLTGHCGLRLHLQRCGVFDGVPGCRKCGLHDETAEHILFDCRGLEQVRTATFGKLTKGSVIPEEGLVKTTLEFLELSGLFQ